MRMVDTWVFLCSCFALDCLSITSFFLFPQLEMLEEENATLKKDLERLKTHLDRRTEELEINGNGNKDLQELTQAQEEVIQTLSEKQRQMTDGYLGVVSEKDRYAQNCAALQVKYTVMKITLFHAFGQLILQFWGSFCFISSYFSFRTKSPT